MIRIGHGYDVHRFKEGRECILCGVRVPYERGPDGHSDADVPLHALMDALLGAAALGDIGQHFPDSDIRYKGISSLVLLKEVVRLLMENGYVLSNADITIVAQKPKIAPFIPDMRRSIADAIGIPVENINVKATTEEGLGFTGDGSGLASHAVVLITGIG